MGNILNTVKRFSKNDSGAIPFQRCSNLPIEASILNKCTCVDTDGSLTGKIDSVTKGTIDGCEGFHKKIDNDGFHLTTAISSRVRCFDDVNFVTLSTAHIEQSGSVEADKNRGTQNETVDTIARELGFDEYSQNGGLIYSKTADNMLHNLKDESTKIPTSLMISSDFVNKVCSRNPELADELETSPSIDIHKRKEFRSRRVSPADSLSGNEHVDVLSFGCKSSLGAAFEGQRHDRTQHKQLIDDTAPIKNAIACATFNARGLDSIPKTSSKRRAIRKTTTAKASNQMLVSKENIRTLVPEASSKGRGKRKRTSIKASNQMFVPKENSGISVPSDVICVEIEKEPMSPLVEQSCGENVLQSTPKSRISSTPLSYVHQSSLTRSMAKSISTPESMKRSRSGRLIVPRLDPGSQNIIYGPDGIIGVTNLALQCPRGSHSEPPPKRRKSFRHLSQNHNRLLTF